MSNYGHCWILRPQWLDLPPPIIRIDNSRRKMCSFSDESRHRWCMYICGCAESKLAPILFAWSIGSGCVIMIWIVWLCDDFWYYASLILNPKVSLTLRVTVITFNRRRIQYAAQEETFVSTYPGASLGVTTTLFVSEC